VGVYGFGRRCASLRTAGATGNSSTGWRNECDQDAEFGSHHEVFTSLPHYGDQSEKFTPNYTPSPDGR
jgi:hypothetical protein